MDMKKYARRSSFIRLDDVRSPRDETIAHVKEGRFGKPDITFESGKVLSLNGSNTETLINAFGEDSDRWLGKRIRLALGTIRYQGEDNEAVVVELASPSESPFNDSIPF